MNQRDFIILLLTKIAEVKRSMTICNLETYHALRIRYEAFRDVLREGLKDDPSAIESVGGILGDLQAGQVEQTINDIMGVNNARRTD